MTDQRTTQQNKALHKWCRQCAEVLESSDLEYSAIVEIITNKGIEVMWDDEVFKSLFRSTLAAAYGLDSTARADTKQYNKIYEAFCRLFGSNGVTLPPWPSRDSRGEA